MNRKTKIVCTIGPGTAQPEMMRQLILAGMDVARLNCLHTALFATFFIHSSIQNITQSFEVDKPFEAGTGQNNAPRKC